MLRGRRIIHHIRDLEKPQSLGYEGRVALGDVNIKNLESDRSKKKKAKKNWSKKKK